MTEPDEARIAWNACVAARYDDEENGNPLGLPQGMPNFEDFRDGYRAGAAASAERIKALEAEFEGGPVCQPIVSKSDEPQTFDRAALEALILVVERDGHDGSHLEDDDGQNECPVCATVATIRAMREAL